MNWKTVFVVKAVSTSPSALDRELDDNEYSILTGSADVGVSLVMSFSHACHSSEKRASVPILYKFFISLIG